MVSINPTGSNETVNNKNLIKKDEKAEEKSGSTSVWSKYDDVEYGEKGVIDEDEVDQLVRDNIPTTDGVRESAKKYENGYRLLKNFVGKKWNSDNYTNMVAKLKDFLTNFSSKPLDNQLGAPAVDEAYQKKYNDITNWGGVESGEIDTEAKLYKLLLLLSFDPETGKAVNPSSSEIRFIEEKFYNSKFAKEHGNSDVFKRYAENLEAIIADSIETETKFELKEQPVIR